MSIRKKIKYKMGKVKDKLKESADQRTDFGNFMRELYGYSKLFRFYFSPIKTMKVIHLQFTNYCNLNCKWCSFVNQKKKQFMSKKLLCRVFDEIIKNKNFNIQEINLWSAGEVLTHPDFIKMLRLMKSYKNKYPLRFPKINLLTNVMLLTPKTSEEILKLEIIDWFGFSVDGGSKEECEKIGRGCKFETIQNNIRDFQKINKRKIKTTINCLNPLNYQLGTSWMSSEFKELFNLVDEYKLNYPLNNGTEFNGTELIMEYPPNFKFYKTGKRICVALLQGMVVIQNGDVLPCCADFNGNYPIGNLYKQSLSEICTGTIRRKMVLDLFKGKKRQIPLCKNCNRYEVPYKIYKQVVKK